MKVWPPLISTACPGWPMRTLYSGWLEYKHLPALVNLQDLDCIFPCLGGFTPFVYNLIISKIPGALHEDLCSFISAQCLLQSYDLQLPHPSASLISFSSMQQAHCALLGTPLPALRSRNRLQVEARWYWASSCFIPISQESQPQAASVQRLKIVVLSTAQFSIYLWWRGKSGPSASSWSKTEVQGIFKMWKSS